MVEANVDAPKVLGVQAAFIGQCTNHGTWAHVVTFAHVKAVQGHVAIPAIVTITSTTVAVTPVKAVTAIATVTPAPFEAVTASLRRGFLHQELVTSLRLRGQSCSDVLQRDVVFLRICLHEVTEDADLVVFQ